MALRGRVTKRRRIFPRRGKAGRFKGSTLRLMLAGGRRTGLFRHQGVSPRQVARARGARWAKPRHR